MQRSRRRCSQKKISLAESSNQSEQQAICRAYKESIKKRDTASSRRQEIVLSSPLTTVSPLTGDTTSTAVVTAGGNSTSQPPSTPTTPGSRQALRLKQKPKLHLTRKNMRAMQKHRVNKLAISDYMKRAFKRATSWYSRELKKPNGKSSYEDARLVRNKYDGLGPLTATIQRYVNAKCLH